MKIRVSVRLKSGVLDVQGKAVEKALHDLGFLGAGQVRIGKLIEMELDGVTSENGKINAAEAKKLVSTMCEKLLVNSVIEDAEITLLEK